MTVREEIESRPANAPIYPGLIERGIREGHRLRSEAFRLMLKDVRKHLPFGA